MGAVMDGDEDVPDRTGNRHPALAMAPYNTYPCTDGYVAVFTAAERHWHSMCRLLGRPELLDDPDFSSTVGRARRMAEALYMLPRAQSRWRRVVDRRDVPHVRLELKRVRDLGIAREHLGDARSA